jgi:hypothetical protein
MNSNRVEELILELEDICTQLAALRARQQAALTELRTKTKRVQGSIFTFGDCVAIAPLATGRFAAPRVTPAPTTIRGTVTNITAGRVYVCTDEGLLEWRPWDQVEHVGGSRF